MATEYSHCSVCRRNHNEGRKHVYQKGHKEKLKLVLKKFAEKFRVARPHPLQFAEKNGEDTSAVRNQLVTPEVLDGELEPGSSVWCYCCECEVVKHISDRETTVVWGGMVEHMRSPEHHKRVRHFCWCHSVDQEAGKRMVVEEKEFISYKERISNLLDRLMADKMVARERLGDEISAKESRQRIIAASHAVDEGQVGRCGQAAKDPPRNVLVQNTPKQLNVHEGGLPPWLQDETPPTPTIGPSEDDFIKHKAYMERSKKSSKRVGANFHLTVAKDTGEDWLPLFGSVWNSGPRSHSKMEFKKKMGKMSSLKSSLTTPTTLCPSSTPTPVTPFTSRQQLTTPTPVVPSISRKQLNTPTPDAPSDTYCQLTTPTAVTPIITTHQGLTVPSTSRQHLTTPSTSHKLLATPSTSHKLLATPSTSRQLLAPSSTSCQQLATPSTSHRQLATPTDNIVVKPYVRKRKQLS